MRSEISRLASHPTAVMASPRNVHIYITSACNLRCIYCCHFGSSSDVKRDLGSAEWLTFFEELGRARVISVDLLGGEPFVRYDLPELLDGIARNHMRYRIMTNGTLVSERVARCIAAGGVCGEVIVSVDGDSATTNDPFRGWGSFTGAMGGIDVLQKHGVPVSVAVTVHKKNVGKLRRIGSYFIEEIGTIRFYTNTASYLGLCRTHAGRVMLDASESLEALEALVDLRSQYGVRVSNKVGPLQYLETWKSMVQERRELLDRKRRDGDGSLLPIGCRTIFSSIAVRSDGIMTPCTFLTHMALGRINRDDLVQTWRNNPKLRRLRERSITPMAGSAYCADCEYARGCAGGCPALAHSHSSVTEQPNPEGCLRRFGEELGARPDEVCVLSRS